mgnify:FL=1
MVGRALKSVSRLEGETKTGVTKLVPVHPVLREALSGWFHAGWREVFGRDPRPLDLIVPTASGRPILPSQGRRDLERDCAKLEIPFRRQHGFRHAFVHAVRDQGLRTELVRWVTHAPPTSAWDGYGGPPWAALCGEIARLELVGQSSGAPGFGETSGDDP